MVAEDVAAVVPQAVVRDSESDRIAGIDYDVLIPFLVEAIKEQQDEIRALRQELDGLTEVISRERSQ